MAVLAHHVNTDKYMVHVYRSSRGRHKNIPQDILEKSHIKILCCVRLCISVSICVFTRVAICLTHRPPSYALPWTSGQYLPSNPSPVWCWQWWMWAPLWEIHCPGGHRKGLMETRWDNTGAETWRLSRSLLGWEREKGYFRQKLRRELPYRRNVGSVNGSKKLRVILEVPSYQDRGSYLGVNFHSVIYLYDPGQVSYLFIYFFALVSPF